MVIVISGWGLTRLETLPLLDYYSEDRQMDRQAQHRIHPCTTLLTSSISFGPSSAILLESSWSTSMDSASCGVSFEGRKRDPFLTSSSNDTLRERFNSDRPAGLPSVRR